LMLLGTQIAETAERMAKTQRQNGQQAPGGAPSAAHAQ
jgi:hypothetical protein